jgi:flagellar biosynthesis protein FlhB
MTEQNEQNRSERATPFKLSKAREKGAVARGVDLGYLASLVTFIGFLWMKVRSYEPDSARTRAGLWSRRRMP